MSKLTFTPGPWIYAPDYDENDGDIIITTDFSRPVSIAFKSDLQDEEQYPVEEVRANANLIAAAPELFDVVRRWDEMWSRYIIPPGGGWPMVYEEHEDIRRAAAEVLKKIREATL